MKKAFLLFLCVMLFSVSAVAAEIPDGATVVGYDVTENPEGVAFFVWNDCLVGDPRTSTANLPDGAVVVGTASDGLPYFRTNGDTTPVEENISTILDTTDNFLTLPDGTVIDVPVPAFENWDAYAYRAIYTNSQGQYVFALSVDAYRFVRVTDERWRIVFDDCYIAPPYAQELSHAIGLNMSSYGESGVLVWTDFDIYDNEGNLVHAAGLLQDNTETETIWVRFDCYPNTIQYDSRTAEEVYERGVPRPSTINGYTFDGWYFDEEFTQPYYYGYVFTTTTTLHAKWIEQDNSEYTISFVTGVDGLTVDPVSSSGFVAPSLEHPEYRFDGWYHDEALTLPYDSSYVFICDTTLYAKMTPAIYITLLEPDGTYVVTFVCYEGDEVSLSFYWEANYSGCFWDEACEVPYYENTILTEDTTLYIKPVVSDVEDGEQTSEDLTELLEHVKGLDILQSQLWIILVVGLLFFVYKFFRMFF